MIPCMCGKIYHLYLHLGPFWRTCVVTSSSTLWDKHCGSFWTCHHFSTFRYQSAGLPACFVDVPVTVVVVFLVFPLGADFYDPPPPPLPPRFISYCFISSHMLLLLLPAACRGFLVRLRLRLCSCSMPSMCPLVASSAFGLPFLICMLPLPFASLSSCPDACGLLFLSHVPCLLSLFCLLPFVEVGPALRPRIVFVSRFTR